MIVNSKDEIQGSFDRHNAAMIIIQPSTKFILYAEQVIGNKMIVAINK